MNSHNLLQSIQDANIIETIPIEHVFQQTHNGGEFTVDVEVEDEDASGASLQNMVPSIGLCEP